MINYKFILVCTFCAFIIGCVGTKKRVRNDFEEYYYSESGDSTLHVKCEGNENYTCWEYYKNSQLKCLVRYEDNRLIEILEVYDTLGEALDFGILSNGDGFVRCYDNEGDLKSSGRFHNGMRNGWWLNYHFSGQVLDSVFYEDGIIIGDNSVEIPNNKY